MRESHHDEPWPTLVPRVEPIPAPPMEPKTDPVSDAVDLVNRPPYYTNSPSGIECIDVVEHLPFNRGAAIKYVWRAGVKSPETELQDLEKARWFIDREIARVKKLTAPPKDEGR